ncbi:transcriptional regulator [Chitinophaga silvatica]|uniref:Transcriptional regulator n=1 Tax=Chitinophaga silvatica TaxID=2282649 RepID=A0A3E1YG36_9BACT|nr:two-component regulator propeller domain-containing protein [Chitinophaga silvatica]RFS26332.1 transcriptional regulator [Chitinophaga silvatica]
MLKVIPFFLLSIFLFESLTAQNTIGLPDIISYNSKDFHASAEIRCQQQDKNGILYIANNDGLLTFNGRYWQLHPLPNKASIRSLAIDSSGKVYVGGHDEIGYFEPATNGLLIYHSLKHLVPPVDHQFADIWDINITPQAVYFRTIESIFELKENKINFLDAPGGWMMMTWLNGRLYTNDRSQGLLTLQNNKWETACAENSYAHLRIRDMTNYRHDTLLVASLSNGLFFLHQRRLTPFKTSIDPLLLKDRINSIKQLGKRYAIGTTGNGLFILDENGQLLQHFSRNEGLQHNNVLSLFQDRDQNLWLGLENGLDFINYNTALKHIYPDKYNQVSGTSVIVHNDHLFVGTSNGLYTLPLRLQDKDFSTGSGNFTEVAQTNGQVWALQEVDKQLLMAHQDGAFVISNGNATPLATQQGVWTFLPQTTHPHQLIAGSYTGLLVIDKNLKPENVRKVDSLYESMRFLASDNRIIWGSHPYRGVFRISLSDDQKTVIRKNIFSQKDGLPGNTNNFVYRLKNRVVAATEKGIYEYNEATGKWAVSSFFKPIFKDMPVRYLTEDNFGNIWFVSNQLIGVVDFSQSSDQNNFTINWFPSLPAQANTSPGYIYPYDQQNIFICSSKGIYHINYEQYVRTNTQMGVMLNAVTALSPRDSVLFGGYIPVAQAVAPTLPADCNSLRFEFTASAYQQPNSILFSCRLTGWDKEWSDWSDRTEKDFTNLPSGTYNFLVRAKNTSGNISEAISYTFIILPPWYKTVWAYLLYIAAVATGIFQLLHWHRKRLQNLEQQHETARKQMHYQHQLELFRNEKEIIALQNDKLATEINLKNKELATVTMHMVSRGQLISRIKEELSYLLKKKELSETATDFKPIFRLLEDAEKGTDWEQFAAHFDEVHHNFLSTLKKKFPVLSTTDLKLCAYLKLNLSSKEIAQLMNISVKGVEISRYRLRKKLQLATAVNLYDFLIQVVES